MVGKDYDPNNDVGEISLGNVVGGNQDREMLWRKLRSGNVGGNIKIGECCWGTCQEHLPFSGEQNMDLNNIRLREH